jgi:hypothetical protein
MTTKSAEFHLREATAADGAAIRAVVAAVMSEYGLSADLEADDADGDSPYVPPTLAVSQARLRADSA